MLAAGFEGRMMRFLGYLPGVAEPFDLELVSASDEADLALLCCVVGSEAEYLPLAEGRPEPGEAVLVIGFPLGIRALMARTRPEFVEGLRNAGVTDFWEIAERLSRAGHVTPLASRGIVGQVTTQNVVYDAETTSGGSGGPVLSLDGQVVAINAAILPEFGGSNLGVPSARARELLSAVERPR
jgi:S1-C subfamily serine protease